MKICAFLWTYYGYPNSNYEGVNVELMRYRNGAIMARDEAERGGVPEVDFVAGVPDSGVPHAMGYANHSGKPLRASLCEIHPDLAALLHAGGSAGAQQSGAHEADPRAGADRGKETAVCG